MVLFLPTRDIIIIYSDARDDLPEEYNIDGVCERIFICMHIRW